jgi:hypothetical protein
MTIPMVSFNEPDKFPRDLDSVPVHLFWMSQLDLYLYLKYPLKVIHILIESSKGFFIKFICEVY